MTLHQALDAFILDQKLKGNTEKTIAVYRGFIGQLIAWLAKKNITAAADLTLQHVQNYQLHISGRSCENKPQKLTRRTVNTYMRNIRIFLAFCYAEGFITEPIHLKMKLPKAEKPIIEILTDEEIDTLFSVLEECGNIPFGDEILTHRNRAMVCLMLDCGLRVSEVAGISEGDINFANSYVKVTGKGRKSRIVPLGQETLTAVQKYLHHRPKHDGKLFLSVRGTPLTPSGIIGLMNRLKKQTQIPRLHAHLFRHTFAANFLLLGGDVYDLSRLLGHSEIKITESYLHLSNYYKIMQNRSRQTYLDIKKARER